MTALPTLYSFPIPVPSYRQIFKSTGLLGSVQALNIALNVVRAKVAALLIGAAGMGLADLYMRTMSLAATATNCGLSLSAVKQLAPLCEPDSEPALQAEAHRQAALIRTWVLVTALAGAALCALFAPWLSRWLTGSEGHSLLIAWLGPATAFTTLAGGETAILQASRRLKALARATAWGGVTTLISSCTFYWLWGVRGIVPMLTVSTAALLALLMWENRRAYPYRLCRVGRSFVREGLPLIRLGTAYILAGVMASGVELLIRVALQRLGGGLAAIGLYAAGFTLTVNYARLLFVGVDADYYPRLSATAGRREANVAINRQINVLVVLMAPFLVMLGLALPLLVRVLYTAEFDAIIPMVLCAAPSMYFKAVCMPIAYLPLARGHSALYLGMELTYSILFGIVAVAGYHYGGLAGSGIALAVAHLADLAMVWAVYRRRYGYRMNRGTLVRIGWLFVLLLAGLAGAALAHPLWRWGLSLAALALMMPQVWPILRRLKR